MQDTIFPLTMVALLTVAQIWAETKENEVSAVYFCGAHLLCPTPLKIQTCRGWFFFLKHFVRQLHIRKPVLAEDNEKHVNYELSIKQRGQEETNLRIIS